MNSALLKATIKSNWILLVIFTIIKVSYLIMIESFFDPENLKAIEAAIKMAPAALTATLGMDAIPVTLVDFVANYFYGFLIQLFLIVYGIILPIRLVVKHVDTGSMSYFLSTPNSRAKIIITQAVYMIGSFIVMIGVVTVLALVFAESLFPGRMDISAFLSLNFTTFLVASAMGSITFFFSCLWNDVKLASWSSSGILVLFFIFKLVGRYGHHKGVYGSIEKLSIFQLLQARGIVSGEINMVMNNIILLLIITVLLSSAIFIFKRKDLPL